ncbi:Sodium/potassium/calcium exchanger 2 [Takifugu flavidus]|uniref:Sodium/potassium/calcium exchanger 2 n=1 Tax=Takifugu flavidus TaxID=433684 RepID=A0A5C6N736_9TELE|nr:Sodium/potassium/calcium exchanger 2 [Takifugu flavidus]
MGGEVEEPSGPEFGSKILAELSPLPVLEEPTWSSTFCPSETCKDSARLQARESRKTWSLSLFSPERCRWMWSVSVALSAATRRRYVSRTRINAAPQPTHRDGTSSELGSERRSLSLPVEAGQRVLVRRHVPVSVPSPWSSMACFTYVGASPLPPRRGRGIYLSCPTCQPRSVLCRRRCRSSPAHPHPWAPPAPDGVPAALTSGRIGRGDASFGENFSLTGLQARPRLQRGGSSASLHNSLMRNSIFQLMIHTLDPLSEGGSRLQPLQERRVPLKGMNAISRRDSGGHFGPTVLQKKLRLWS